MTLEDIKIIDLPEDRFYDYHQLRLELLQDSPQASASSYDVESTKTQEQFEAETKELLEEKSAIILVAQHEGKFVGTVGSYREASPNQHHIAIIFRMYVSKNYRGLGIGKKLLKTLINRLEKDETIAKLNLDVTTTQIPAINLYKSLGFKIVGKLKKEYFINNKFYDIYEMDKLLR